ncbi:hypothetical protein [Siminovitchia sp. 179-K 8D1 HS]|uniref:hypothetical protein n=1 Tax=Siminovitchia sp. 179-K 8D1 HS TaxID=3142385 RepID=UPI0039A0C387
MEKETFEAIKEYEILISQLYMNLFDLGVSEKDEVQWMYDDLEDLHDRLFKIGEYEDKDKAINKEGYLIKDYNGLPKYFKLLIIYRYENGYCLCKNTAGHVELIPKDLISYDI